ncbi:MAG: hypothetical protein V3U59_04035 [Gammaproteobacteria bacterium]
MLKTLRILAAISSTLAGGVFASDDVYRYRIEIDAALSRADVRACFADVRPRRLVSGTSGAGRYLLQATNGDGQPLSRSRDRLSLHTGADTDCIHYSIDLDAATDGDFSRSGIVRLEDAIVLPPGVWFWYPDPWPPGREIRLSFVLPSGFSVSVPWPETDGNDFRVTRTPRTWRSYSAIGRFNEHELAVPGASLRLAVLNNGPPVDPDLVDTWLGEAATAVSGLYGRFPIESPQIIVVPIGRGGAPVPWAHVLRGGSVNARFFIDQRQSLSEFREDWTATHELSHMLLPYLGRSGAWLSEGIASYYQNVLRSKAGMLDEREAWQKLHDGFRRGVRDTSGETLRETSGEMHGRGAYMRVYWSGAAIALMADVELRRRTNGRESLASALDKFQRCCLPSERRWQPEEFLARLDELTGDVVFSSTAERWLDSDEFPDVRSLYPELGISVRFGRVRLTDDAPLAELRAQIARSTPAILTSRTVGKVFQDSSPNDTPLSSRAVGEGSSRSRNAMTQKEPGSAAAQASR